MAFPPLLLQLTHLILLDLLNYFGHNRVSTAIMIAPGGSATPKAS